MIAFRTIYNDTERQMALGIRHDVFVIGQGVDEALEHDEHDATATHFIAMDGDAPIATARIRVVEDYTKIERVAVISTHRGKDIGAGLMQSIHDHIRETKLPKDLKLGAQESAIGFYERLGYTTYGDWFLDADIRHKMMEMRL